MAHNYMMYTRTSSGVVARTHRTAQLEDVTSYTEEEKLGGWPEAFVFWQPMADGSAVGVAPESGAAFAALPQLATH